MMPRINLFTKMVTLIVVMLVPIMALYYYSNKTSTQVLGTELNKSNTEQLTFFQHQVNTQIDLLTLWPNLLMHDPDISSFKDVFLASEYLNLDTITLVKRIQTKLSIQENSSNWDSELFIYSPSLNRVVSVADARHYDTWELKRRLKPGWQVKELEGETAGRYQFSWFTVSPYATYKRPEDANLIIEVRFDSTNIVDMLDRFKSDGRREPVYYRQGIGAIYNRTADRDLADRIIAELERGELHDIESRTVELDGEKYLVNAVKSRSTGWHLVDFMPLSDIVRPIRKSNELFTFSVAGLLLMSCLAAYLMYAQVQVPLKRLVVGFQKLKNGDYSVRMVPKGRTEFSFVFDRFNSMVMQIQELFQHVYLEKIHVREARLKQLQSQINPHFFYNCFSFISSMAKLNNNKAVVEMSQRLAKYYRYTTRQERDLVKLSEEIGFVTSYLDIQNMRMPRLRFEVNVPERMKKADIPPLVIQPLVENAVLHGIEPQAAAGFIRITGHCGEDGMRIVVEDNGKGMSVEAMLVLQYKLSKPMDREMGCGVWNVHQRMQLRFGGQAGISFAASPLGGLKATLYWPYEAREVAATNGETNDPANGMTNVGEEKK
ncbi:hypothetical protein PACILC2_32540 [Paenibacillus cisolokensis]|uniref:HAMP domain-containing protein n=1 Tax=Paenibacillus cisolokensis TaxID=1658519 RepID=A0ABQ4N911_9BACL|nr:histidine kinase [Paenibacillus cisolokensis]GIQ64686.1 hypothetical protein PACILC2_32540 [Paenibacillus cisolokensis]